MTGERVGGAVTWRLLGAWVVHDLDELATVPGWLRRNAKGLRKRFPQVPEEVRRRAETMGAAEFATAVGVMGAVVGTAAAAGRLTGGRSGFCQSALTGFGPHGVMHLAQAAAVRGCTPGSVTSPLVVLPFTLWARGRLRRPGGCVPRGRVTRWPGRRPPGRPRSPRTSWRAGCSVEVTGEEDGTLGATTARRAGRHDVRRPRSAHRTSMRLVVIESTPAASRRRIERRVSGVHADSRKPSRCTRSARARSTRLKR